MDEIAAAYPFSCLSRCAEEAEEGPPRKEKPADDDDDDDGQWDAPLEEDAYFAQLLVRREEDAELAQPIATVAPSRTGGAAAAGGAVGSPRSLALGRMTELLFRNSCLRQWRQWREFRARLVRWERHQRRANDWRAERRDWARRGGATSDGAMKRRRTEGSSGEIDEPTKKCHAMDEIAAAYAESSLSQRAEEGPPRKKELADGDDDDDGRWDAPLEEEAEFAQLIGARRKEDVEMAQPIATVAPSRTGGLTVAAGGVVGSPRSLALGRMTELLLQNSCLRQWREFRAWLVECERHQRRVNDWRAERCNWARRSGATSYGAVGGGVATTSCESYLSRCAEEGPRRKKKIANNDDDDDDDGQWDAPLEEDAEFAQLIATVAPPRGADACPKKTKKAIPKRITRSECSVDGCARFKRMGGMCWRHYSSTKDAEASSAAMAKRFGPHTCTYVCMHQGCSGHVAEKGGLCPAHKESRPKKRKVKKKCSVEGCTSYVVNNGVCFRHGAKGFTCTEKGCVARAARKGGFCAAHGGGARKAPPPCSVDGCPNLQINNGVCITHGATRRICSSEGCDKRAVKGGLCHDHGEWVAPRAQICNREGCTDRATKDGFCAAHGTARPACNFEGCTNPAGDEGFCRRHDGKNTRTLCRHEGCCNYVQRGGLCFRHGAIRPRCSHEGCAKFVTKQGVCIEHGAAKWGCRFEGCASWARKGGFCVAHGGKVQRRICSHPNCTSGVFRGGVCMRHGMMIPRPKVCSREGCTDQAGEGGVCRRHSNPTCEFEGCTSPAGKEGFCRRHDGKNTRTLCSHEGCCNFAQRGRLCARHGAIRPRCSHEGCAKFVHSQGVCFAHGATRWNCRWEGCTRWARRGGFCVAHGGKRCKKTCRHEGCTNQVINNGVCQRHGARVHICIREGCALQAMRKGGVCPKHGRAAGRKMGGMCRLHYGATKDGKAAFAAAASPPFPPLEEPNVDLHV